MLKRAYLVQDLESFAFLYPTDDGDVGYTRTLKDAGHFNDEDEAFDTAQIYCTEGFFIFSFYVREAA